MKNKWVIVSVAVALMIALFVGIFYSTSGNQLINLYTKYLSQDISDKKYSYEDFTDRGPRTALHGYYAGTVGNSIYVWTYSGLKRFVHQPETSVYYYANVCETIKKLSEQPELVGTEEATTDPHMSFDLQTWLGWVKRGDYIWIKRVGEGDESKVIDKIWGNNNNYPYGGITLSQCKST